MAKIIFVYMKKIFIKAIKEKEVKIHSELRNFAFLIGKDFIDLYFLYKGKKLNLKKSLKSNNLTIFVFDLKSKKNENNKIIQNNFICPECENLSIVDYNNNKFTIEKCTNKHKLSNLSLDIFIYLQNIEKMETNELIKCCECKNNKNYYNKFYICSCNKYICPLCQEKHKEKNNSHKIIEYYKRFSYCINHHQTFKSYCHSCKINICIFCEREKHNNHKIELYKEKYPTEKYLNELKIELNYSDIKKKEYSKEIEILKEKFNNFINYN